MRKRNKAWGPDEGGYLAIQSTRPQTLAYGLVDATFVGGLTLTAGDPVYLSLTSGQLTNDVSGITTSGDAIAEVGILVSPLSYNGPSNFTARVSLQIKSITIV